MSAINNHLLKELADKYYSQLEDMVNYLASRCVGDSEASLVFNSGKVTIKLK